ncbi:MAG: S-layer homology domain-containing protein [Selenomonas sp.]|uniref:S-layer homology domain-containing protein n=1 Tax=uncultured Selenomonas sp. TaxID=159275 RepID=UPI0025CB8459|nr:S-layer homology domain-containing protein [uncultured Selenomonas sp.]MDY6350005.1 S-layer homology domain-containing protein [Selenomonas sp.]
MKKTLVSALTTALVVGAASTTFAASNPFSDVPADHWAYDAVSQLAADGVIEGYGDSTFQGNKNITRYEMAQMVAKAMAKTDVSAADKAMIDKLAAEFADELNNLGVRVANLEKHADNVKFTGKLEYTYTSTRYENEHRTNTDGYVFRLEPTAEVNDHWDIHARLDGNGDLSKDTTTNVSLERAWAQGNYKNFTVKLGKQPLYTNEHGLVFDETFSGANLEFGNQLKATLLAGRVNANLLKSDRYAAIGGGFDADGNVVADDTANLQGINLQYAGDSKLYGGVGYYHLDSNDFKALKNGQYTHNNDEDSADIWSANLGYNFDAKNALWASYANNTKADEQDYAWQVEYDYGNYQDAANKGSWGWYGAYRRLGQNASLMGTYDGVQQGTKGWEIGAQYAIFKNVGILAKYFDGEQLDNGKDASKLFGRVEFFF